MTWLPSDPRGTPTGNSTLMPFVFCAQAERWTNILGQVIDEMSSDPRTLDMLSHFVCFTEPTVLVEVGTYRGWGTACLAETLRFYGLPGHVWSCDPVDYGVQEMIDAADLSDRVTLVQGTFEHLLAQLTEPIGFCYIDASDLREASLRLRYTKLALQHMTPGGVICVDDATGGWRGAKSLRRMANLYLPQRRGLAVITR